MGTKNKYFRPRGKCISEPTCEELKRKECICPRVLYLDERHCGVKLSDCLHTTDKKIAEIRRREIHIAVERGDYSNYKYKFADIVDEFLDRITCGLAESTKNHYHLIFSSHLIPWFGEARLIDICQNDLLEYKLARESKGVGQVALTQEMWLFRKLLAFKGITIKPLTDGFKKPASVIDRFPTEPEVLSIIDETSDHVKPAFLCMAYSGLRKGDCLGLTWDSIDFRSGFIRHRQKKTGIITRAPLHEILLDIFSMVPRGVGKTKVFKLTRRQLDYAWDNARNKVNLSWVRIHDLRHFYLSHMANSGVDMGRLKELAGHKSVKTTQRYVHFSDESLKEATSIFVRSPSANFKKGRV